MEQTFYNLKEKKKKNIKLFFSLNKNDRDDNVYVLFSLIRCKRVINFEFQKFS